eukprot:c5259_g1_i1.p1 GENE.c5259_g1_i1~~c5259_g1_i1.p1  ORF type:complete len:417 (+),score=107.50 c5259_g1_i1:41-1291(+)
MRILLCVLLCGVVAGDAQAPSTAFPLPLVLTAQKVSRIAREMFPSQIDHSHSLSMMLSRGVPSGSVPPLDPPALEVLSRLPSIDDSRISKAVGLAYEFATNRPNEIQTVVSCMGRAAQQNPDCSHANTTAMLTSLAVLFAGHKQVTGGAVGRPSMGVYGVEYHATRCLFWLFASFVHFELPFSPYHPTPMRMIAKLIQDEAWPKLKSWLGTFGPLPPAFESDPATEARDKARKEDWRTIMTVFASFDEFRRMYESNPSFSDMIKDMCSSSHQGQLVIKSKNEKLNVLEACWNSKKASVFQTETNGSAERLLTLPLVPSYVLGLLALMILFMEAPHVGGCADVPTTDWTCTNGNIEGSVCLLSCPNAGTNIRGINPSGRASLVTCRGGTWHPNVPGTCASVSLAVYDYGTSRGTPLF